MTPQPELAESWQISPDGLTWTFKLRQGVKFHDGQEFTSADVKFTFDRLLEKSQSGKSDFNAVDKVEPVGKHTVKFVTKEPFAALVAALGGFWGFIVSEAGVKKYGDLNKNALGTGPFILDDWKVEQQMVFKRNPSYWKKGLPHADELILRVIPDEANIVAALRTGQIHHAFIEDNKNFNLLKDEKSLTGYRSSRLGYDYLNINATRGPLKDVRVRQAISWAVDRAQVMRVATAGFGRLTAPCTAPMKQWQLPEEQWMKYYKPDVERAKKLMAEAGVGSGFSVKCMVIPTFPTMVSGAPVIAAQLKRIGINMEIENVEYAVWIKRWQAHDFDMTMNTTPGYADPDVAFFRALHSTKGQNWNSWSVPAVDALLEEGRKTMDPKKRKETYDKLQIAILENVPHLRLYSMAVTLAGLSLLVFLMLRLVPGTVVEQLIGADAVVNPKMVAELKRFFGLDQPWWKQYATWIAGLAHGDLGTSWRTGKPVVTLILERLPVTIELTGLAVAFALLIGIPTGILSATRRDQAIDNVTRVGTLLGLSVPVFWQGTMLILFFSIYLRWMPPLMWVDFFTDPRRNLTIMLLPALCLGTASAANIARTTRVCMLDVLRSEYIRTAAAKGLTGRLVLLKHALNNALIPIVTVAGLQIGILLGGTVVVEEVFTLPGIGRLVLWSIYQRDYPLTQSTILFIAVMFMTINLAVDVLYGYLDPRIRYSA